jgi:hypothetical protein
MITIVLYEQIHVSSLVIFCKYDHTYYIRNCSDTNCNVSTVNKDSYL